MKERTIWLRAGQEVEYCPYCRGSDVWPCEVPGLWTCEGCHSDFIVRHRKLEPPPKARAMSPAEFQALEERQNEV